MEKTETNTPTPVSSIGGIELTLTRTLGGTGAAYDPPGPHRAYTYEHQPHNVPAYRLGCALSAATHEGGDTIDAGLYLLKALQARGFGVFEIEPANPTHSSSPRLTPAERFACWLENGPKLAKAAGVYVGIKVTNPPTPTEGR